MKIQAGKINWDDLNMEKSTYDPTEAYKQSKLANILFTNQLKVYLESKSLDHVSVFSVSPGVVLTELGRHIMQKSLLNRILSVIFYPLLWIFMKSPKQGKISLENLKNGI